ncbi:FAD-binding oxidoreductase [Mesorhizobium sp. SP-1A]|uniref:FAD-binding oxidoreductase n=1 Tax=Mesorhizobium sp. SP-1A TaxID=3077840 RepID=UPI0028F73FF9|nr:FAD-binding oxidoreductase [Mesorhizobium sp. SP-1A]
MLEQNHVTELAKLIGDAGVLTAPADLEAYQNGARYDRGRAAAVLRPRTTDQVSAVMAYCVRQGIPLVPQSGNTGLVSGSTPDNTGRQVVLSLDRMNEVFRLDEDNRSLTASAGWRLSDVNNKLEANGLFFPIDLGADPRLGGMIATNTGGSRFLKYGDVRKNTLGLKVVLADEDGTVLNLNNELRKNNTGVDWKQIFIGTSGAFGIVTECVLNVEPLPQQISTAYLVPKSDEHVMTLLRAMEKRFGSELSAFEGMSANAITAAIQHVPSLRNPFEQGIVPSFVILAEVTRSWEPRQGEQTLDAALEGALAEIWEMEGEPLADAFVGPPHEMWSLRHALSEGVSHSGKLIAFDLAFRRGDVMKFLSKIRSDLALCCPDLTICDFGHIGDGGVHLNLVLPKNSKQASDPDFEKQLRDFVFSIVVDEFGGSYSAEHAIGRKNQTYYDLYTPQKLREMTKDMRERFSPGDLGAVRFG